VSAKAASILGVSPPGWSGLNSDRTICSRMTCAQKIYNLPTVAFSGAAPEPPESDSPSRLVLRRRIATVYTLNR